MDVHSPRRSGTQRARGGGARAAAGLKFAIQKKNTHTNKSHTRSKAMQHHTCYNRQSDAPLKPAVGSFGAANPGGAAGGGVSFPLALLLLSPAFLRHSTSHHDSISTSVLPSSSPH